MKKYVVMTGNLTEGFLCYGGFADYEHAEKWIEELGEGWIMEMHDYTI